MINNIKPKHYYLYTSMAVELTTSKQCY